MKKCNKPTHLSTHGAKLELIDLYKKGILTSGYIYSCENHYHISSSKHPNSIIEFNP